MKHCAHHCGTLKGRPGAEMEDDEWGHGRELSLAGALLPPRADMHMEEITVLLLIFFSRAPISCNFEEEAGFGDGFGCLPRPASEEARVISNLSRNPQGLN